MTGIGDRLTQSRSVPVRIDSADPAKLLATTGTGTASSSKFWSSGQRYIHSDTEEVLEIAYGSARMVNLISFEVSRFPCTMQVEWWDSDLGAWASFEYALEDVGLILPSPTRYPIHQSVGLSIAESVPAVVNKAGRGKHPQHFGRRHWRREEWRTVPVVTERIRFVLRRNPLGVPPHAPSGRPVAYSLAMRQIKIGYRISSEHDVPRGRDNSIPWETSKDFLGSTVYYSVYQQSPERAIDGSTKTSWRSAPQPVNYAVVPLFLDMRDSKGEGQTIDKFYVDPTTTGVHCNLYFSNDEPEGDFTGDDEPVPYGFRTEVGATLSTDTHITLGPDTPNGIAVSRTFARADLTGGWWVGIDATATVDSTDTQVRPIVSLGAHQLVQQDGQIKFITQSGSEAAVVLPDTHVADSDFRLVVGHFPSTSARGSYVRLVYVPAGYPPEAVEATMDISGPGDIRIGLHPDPDSTLASAVALRGLVVKTEILSPEAEDWFLDEGEAYIRDDQTWRVLDRHTNLNAVLRMHPVFVSADNPFGVVGGDGDRLMSNAVWSPINRDFLLHRGYMEFPPTKAKYWKFEFTQLSARIYETFQTIDRTVLCYPPSVAEASRTVGPKPTRDFPPHGVATMVSGQNSIDHYSDALTALRRSGSTSGAGPEVAQALVVKAPHLAARAAETGWIWQYQPWHVGSISPRWTVPGKHYYERIPVRHSAKVAYFVGIKELVPYRTNYSQPDDTEEYIERFLDDVNIDTLTAMDLTPDGVVAIGSEGQVTSKALVSYLDVRGIQFATQETGIVQVLRDPDFVNEDLTLFYETYGDATVDRLSKNLVEVTRGWTGRTYLELEAYTYGELEAFTYGDLEGQVAGLAAAEGGVVTLGSYHPLGAGRVMAKVELSAQKALTYPVDVEIISSGTSEVLATTRKVIPPGGLITVTSEFAAQSLFRPRTYGDLEHLPAAGEGGPVEPSEIGPGSYSSASPTPIAPHNLSTTLHEDDRLLHYVINPTETGQISLDSLLSTVAATDDRPAGFSAEIEVLSGMPDVVYTTTEGCTQAVGTVTSGTPVVFTATASLFDGTSTTYPETNLRVRTSEIGDTTLWTPDLSGVAVPDTTYEMLEGYTYGELEMDSGISSEVKVRVRQQGGCSDVFRVHRIALYDEPIVWSFSVDDGATWYAALGVRNDPSGAIVFPTPGNHLRWRAETHRVDASISALHIRPWYGGARTGASPFFDLEQDGPNQSGWDLFPSLPQHPMWKAKSTPIEPIFEVVAEPAPFWRNLVPNPGAEGTYTDQWTVVGGTMDRVDTEAPA